MKISKNFQSSVKFNFSVDRIPNFDTYIQEVSIPFISVIIPESNNPYNRLVWQPDHIEYGSLDIMFKIDENFNSWYDIYSWIEGLSFPQNNKQYRDYVDQNNKTLDGQGRPKTSVPEIGAVHSDGTLTLMSSAMNPHTIINFISMIPTNLTEMKLSTTNSIDEYLTCNATFKYNYIKVSRVV